MSSLKCKYDADAYCYICGQFIKVRDVKYELNTSHVLREAYEVYFNCPVRNQDKTWAPHVPCNICKRCLEGWYRGERRSIKFATPVFGENQKITSTKSSEAKVKARAFAGQQI
ncbi:hypothetical protein GWI33_017896 [Rhynchophorus ferrugineus]|uniref:Uncharacterized protein n=1 Tax=Rhynchophorus ferrugineus TaxID=354439 RepID=A0A834HXC1_RHYFE|nr:hypothetical protein GWI33_017896 [Rhynchophorus ferrugineus]